MALDPQHALQIQGAAGARARGYVDVVDSRGNRDDAVEIVVVVLFFLAVMAGARR